MVEEEGVGIDVLLDAIGEVEIGGMYPSVLWLPKSCLHCLWNLLTSFIFSINVSVKEGCTQTM